MSKQLAAQVTFAVLVCAALVGITRCDGSEEPPESETQQQATADPAARMGALVSLMEDAGANQATRLTVAREVGASHPDEATRARGAAVAAQLVEEIRVANVGRQWSYSRNADAMTSKETVQAVVRSTNTHDLGFPYAGPQRATLVVRRHPTHGSDIIFSIERGQLLCSSYGDCPVRVRFDEGSARTLQGNEPADHSSETIFIPGYRDFVDRLSRSRKLLVEANVYQRGAPVWEFNVEGFKPDEVK